MTEWVDKPLALHHAVKLAQDHAGKLRDLAIPPEFFVLSLATLLDAWRKAGCDAKWVAAAEAAARAAYGTPE